MDHSGLRRSSPERRSAGHLIRKNARNCHSRSASSDASATSDGCVAWIAFAPAELDTIGYVELGPLALFEARWAIPNARKDDGQGFPFRSELREISYIPDDMERDKPRVVLARLDLGHRSVGRALSDARAVTTMLVDAAAVHGRGRRWLPYGWEYLLVDGQPAWSSLFVPEHARDRDGTLWDHERTALELKERGQRLVDALAKDPIPATLEEAVRCASAAAATRESDTRSRVVLNDRVIEMVAASSGLPD